MPVPALGRHFSPQSRASPGRRPGLQSPVRCWVAGLAASPSPRPVPASQKEVKRSQNCGKSPWKTLHTCCKHHSTQNTVVSGHNKRISSRILLSDVVPRRSLVPGQCQSQSSADTLVPSPGPVPADGRDFSPQSRPLAAGLAARPSRRRH